MLLKERLATLHVITDPQRINPIPHASEALAGGAKLIQYRDKLASDQEMIKIGFRLKKLVRASGAMLIVNDRASVAKAIDADGIHLGQDDLPVQEARKILGKKIIGLSVDNAGQALEAIRKRVDYASLGSIFRTSSKQDYVLAGIEELVKTRKVFDEQKISTPLIAIGGITQENILEVLEAGADGIAVISAVSKSPSISSAVARLLKSINKARNKKTVGL